MPIPHFYSSLNVAELRKVANVTERLAQANTFDPILDFKLDGAARLTRQAARTAHRVATSSAGPLWQQAHTSVLMRPTIQAFATRLHRIIRRCRHH